MVYDKLNLELSSSLEDYLEAMYNLMLEDRRVRVKDIAINLNVKKPSVNNALARLKEKGLITQEKYSDVVLTAAGIEIAKAVRSRHSFFYDFLRNELGVSESNASNDACEIEHVISAETFEKFKEHFSNIGKKKS